MKQRLPLEGIRVLDLTRALSGPFCTTLLADLGADVVKVEPPGGDAIRQWGPFSEDVSLYHLAVNRNKRSVIVDSRNSAGRALLRQMASASDVVVENFRRGVLDRVGLSRSWMDSNAPDTMVASVSGYGPDGPLSGYPAFDQICQGMGGLMSITGHEESGPTRVGIPIVDLLSGAFAALGVSASLAGRARGGEFRLVETSLLESVLGVLTFQAQRYLTNSEVPSPSGNDHPVLTPYGLFGTADRPLNIAVATQEQFASLCEIIGASELCSDERYLSGKLRTQNRAALHAAIESKLLMKSASDWLEAMRTSDIPVGPVNRMDEVFAEPQVEALGMVNRLTHAKLGEVDVLRGPLRIGGRPVPITRLAPDLGEHCLEIFEEFGFTDNDVTEFARQGATNCAICGTI